jgi:predicted aspartyl protease
MFRSLRRQCGTTALLFVVFAVTLDGSASAEQPPVKSYFAGPSSSVLALNRLSDGKLYLTVMVQNQPLSLFVDTGAATILDCQVVKGLGRPLTKAEDVATGLTGEADRYLTTVDLALGELKIGNMAVNCLDLVQLRALHARMGWPRLDGLIGADLLSILRARIDYDRKTLSIRRPDARSAAEEKRLRKQ